MTDADLLAAVLASPRLTPGERAAFESMQAWLSRWGSLTQRQREWLQAVGHRVGLDAERVGRWTPRVSAWDPEPKRRRRRAA